ncbi:Bcr/CflA family multidrug efflux transporter [Vibrio sp. UCD-FRSSP16_10]|uniref:purine nucleoside transporter PunC n=1 Tax=unclassified Vibrio TaxID=2614977 RepID=UPI0008002ABB|nr:MULTISPECIES: purine nucleoside transporter PunC [unclassified Vibrio]OBT15633.1 Bcr/CflA family multidrug efflux transporter [Vibrio sp. UCD-FRSSP16_30]OBT21043.1 Bcr/CflA family multidrug efflux transporter [Vibrio sp. UCD-FRSSP16_10]
MSVSKLQLGYLALLSMLGFIATDMYLPAFQTLQAEFATGPEPIALSLSIFLIGLASGQLAWGILSDRFGLRNSLVLGLIIFTVASIGISLSTTVSQLLVFRFIQAIGVCAPTVIWQAMVIQRYQADDRQRIFASIMPLVALSPALAPQLGVLLNTTLGWESIFVVLAIIGTGLLVVTAKQPKEAKPEKSLSLKTDLIGLIKNRTFIGNVTIFSVTSAVFFAYLTGMPEIMTQLGYSAKDIGMSFIPQTIAFMLGGYVGKKAVERYGDGKVLSIILVIFTLAVGAVFIASQSTLTSIWPVLLPFCFVAVANGALYPIVVNRALSSAQNSPATAAGLQNSIQICVSSLASMTVAIFAQQALIAIGWTMLVCLLGLAGGLLLTRQKSVLVEATTQ